MRTPINNSAVYHTWLLVLLWILQFLVEIILMGAFAIAIAQINDYFVSNHGSLYEYDNGASWSDERLSQSAITGSIIFAGVILGIAVLSLCTHVVQITMYARSRLTPVGYFSFELSRFLVWSVVFGLAVAATASRGVGVEVGFVVLVWILYLFSLVYSSVVFHRYRKECFDGPEVVHPSRVRYQNQTVSMGEMA